MSAPTYVVCGCKSWNKGVFDASLSTIPGKWHFVGREEELTPAVLQALQPRFVFFLHWSWKVPREITEIYECINFHMTDVPFGRGGSPLQNLILRGHKDTKLSALRMTDEMDAGPVYLKEDLSLEGSAEEILRRSSETATHMIERIITRELEPKPQQGALVIFERRTPAQSRIPLGLSGKTLYDFIRMLDGEGYPPAFLEHGGFRYEFSDAVLQGSAVEAQVNICPAGADTDKAGGTQSR